MTLDALSQPDAQDDLSQQVAQFYETYAHATCAYLYALVGDWELANDLNQEVYLRLFRTRARLPALENPRAWIYQIATRLAYNALKRRRRFAWLPWSRAQEQVHFAWTHTLEHEFADREAVEQALHKVPYDYRVPLILFSGHGFSVREIAQALEMSESAIKTRLYRARDLFQRAYTEVADVMGNRNDRRVTR